MANNTLPDIEFSEFQSWREECADGTLELEDYLGALVEASGFSDDGLIALMTIMWPRLTEHEGRVFFESRFDRSQLNDIPEDHRERPDFWLNLTLVTAWIEEPAKAQLAAQLLTGAWKARLSDAFPQLTFNIETLVDGDDVAVTFYRQFG